MKAFLSILKDSLHSGVKFQTIPFLVRCMSGIVILLGHTILTNKATKQTDEAVEGR